MNKPILFLHTISDLVNLQTIAPEQLKGHTLVSTLPDLHLKLQELQISFVPIENFITGPELQQAYQDAPKAAAQWFLPFKHLITYKGINLGEITRLNHLHFFREMFAARIITQRILDRCPGPDHVVLPAFQGRPCTTSSSMDGDHDVFSAAIIAVCARRNIPVRFLPAPKQNTVCRQNIHHAPSTSSRKQTDYPAFKRDRQRRFILGYGAGIDLMTLSPVLEQFRADRSFQVLLLSQQPEPPAPSLRSGLSWTQDLPFVWEKDFYEDGDEDQSFVNSKLKDAWRFFTDHDYSSLGEQYGLFNKDFSFQFKYIWDYYFFTAVKFINRFERILRKLKPDIVLSCDDATFTNRILLTIAKRQNILTVGFPHGFVIDPDFYDFCSDVYFSQGKNDKKILSRCLKKPAKRIIPGGSHALYLAAQRARDLQAAPGQQNKYSSGSKILLLTKKFFYQSSCQMDLNRFIVGWKNMLDYINRQPGCEFILKARPEKDHNDWYHGLILRSAFKNLRISLDRLEDLLPQIDIVVMVGLVGIAGLISIAAGKPLVYYNNMLRIPRDTEELWSSAPDLLKVSEKAELFAALDRLREDAGFKAEWLRKENYFLERCIHLPHQETPALTMSRNIIARLDKQIGTPAIVTQRCDLAAIRHTGSNKIMAT